MPANTWQIASPAPDFPFVHTCLFHNAALKWFPHIGGIALGGGESVVAWWMAVVHETAHSPPLALRIHTKTHTKYTCALDVCKCLSRFSLYERQYPAHRAPFSLTRPLHYHATPNSWTSYLVTRGARIHGSKCVQDADQRVSQTQKHSYPADEGTPHYDLPTLLCQ